MQTLISILPVEGQTYRFDWISVIFLVVLLVGIILGIKRGFLSTLLKFFGLVSVVLLAYLLAKPFGTWLYSLNGWGKGLEGQISGFLIDTGAKSLVSTGNELYDAAILAQYGSNNIMEWVVSQSDLNQAVPGSELTVLQTALNAAKIPAFLHQFVGNFVLNAVPSEAATQNLAFYLSASLASFAFIGIGFAAIFLVGYIVLIVLRILAKKLNHAKAIGPVNRLLGGVLGALLAFIDISLISAALVALGSVPQIYSVLDGLLCLSDDSIYTIGKMFYNNNFLEILMGYYNDIASSIMG